MAARVVERWRLPRMFPGQCGSDGEEEPHQRELVGALSLDELCAEPVELYGFLPNCRRVHGSVCKVLVDIRVCLRDSVRKKKGSGLDAGALPSHPEGGGPTLRKGGCRSTPEPQT